MNFFRDALIVSIGNCATSVFSGFVIFSIIGHMAHELNLKVEDVIDQGKYELNVNDKTELCEYSWKVKKTNLHYIRGTPTKRVKSDRSISAA